MSARSFGRLFSWDRASGSSCSGVTESGSCGPLSRGGLAGASSRPVQVRSLPRARSPLLGYPPPGRSRPVLRPRSLPQLRSPPPAPSRLRSPSRPRAGHEGRSRPASRAGPAARSRGGRQVASTSIADRPIRRAGGTGSLTARPRRARVGVVPARAIRACPRRTCASVATVGGTRRPRRARAAGSAARGGFAVTGSG